MRKETKRKENGKTRQGQAKQAERLDDAAAARTMGRVTAAGKDPIRCDAMQCFRRRGDGVGTHRGEVELDVGAGQGKTCVEDVCAAVQQVPRSLCGVGEVRTDIQGPWGWWAELSREGLAG